MILKLFNEKVIYFEWLKVLINMYWFVNDKKFMNMDFVIFKCI